MHIYIYLYIPIYKYSIDGIKNTVAYLCADPLTVFCTSRRDINGSRRHSHTPTHTHTFDCAKLSTIKMIYIYLYIL